MGKTKTSAYRLIVQERGVYITPMSWKSKEWGRPSMKNLLRWIQAWERSREPGGFNAHLGPGRIVSARIEENVTGGAVVVSYVRDNA